MKFEDIQFKSSHRTGGVEAIVKFPNGWAASVVRHEYSYGGTEGLFELAVLDAAGEISYSTPVTDDVLGWLNTVGVEDALAKIEALAPAPSGGVDG